MIVDAQVHFWKANTPDRPWLPDRVAQLPEPFTDRQIRADDGRGRRRPRRYRAAVLGRRPQRLRARSGARDIRRVSPSWGAFRSRTRNPPTLLPDWKKQPGMVGIRLTFHPPQWKWLTDGTVDWFWPLAEKYQLPVMFYGAPMPNFARIAERHPALPMIADHLGVTGEVAKSGKIAEAVGETAALAKYPNVSVKLSTTPFYSAESYPFRDMTAHIRRLFDAFGPRRSYWGTDLTNSLQQSQLPSSASPTSPKRSTSSPRKTRNGSWAAPFSSGSDGNNACMITARKAG